MGLTRSRVPNPRTNKGSTLIYSHVHSGGARFTDILISNILKGLKFLLTQIYKLGSRSTRASTYILWWFQIHGQGVGPDCIDYMYSGTQIPNQTWVPQ